MKNRLVYLDNFKGIASFCVMVHHLMVAYLPVSFFGSNSGNYYDRPFLEWFSQTPLSFITNGNFWVCMFLMISGYIMFSQGYKIEKVSDFSSKFLSRYVKLLIPVIPICIIIFLLKNICNGDIFYNEQVGNEIYSWWLGSGYNAPISLKNLVLSPFTIFFTGDGLFNNAFWMLDELLISSLAVFVIAFCFQNIKKGKFIKYILICFAAMVFNKYYLATFLGGLIYLIASSNLNDKIKHKKLFNFSLIIILLLGIISAGYPSGRIPTNFYSILQSLSLFKSFVSDVEFYHILGSFIILFVLLGSKKLQRIFEFKGFDLLGKNSYSIYLIHVPIIYILSPYIFKLSMNITNRYFISSCVTILLICIIVVILSHWYTKFISWMKDIINLLIDRVYLYDKNKSLKITKSGKLL